MSDDNMQRSVGRLEGKIDIMLEKQADLDERLRNQEKKAAANGAIAGMLTGSFVSVIVAFSKAKLGI